MKYMKTKVLLDENGIIELEKEIEKNSGKEYVKDFLLEVKEGYYEKLNKAKIDAYFEEHNFSDYGQCICVILLCPLCVRDFATEHTVPSENSTHMDLMWEHLASLDPRRFTRI